VEADSEGVGAWVYCCSSICWARYGNYVFLSWLSLWLCASMGSNFAFGLFAAGTKCSVTAPLAGAFVLQQVLGKPRDMKNKYFRLWFTLIMLAGLASSTITFATGRSPVEAIVFAQAVNGVLLPVIAWILLYAANKREHLGEHTNGIIANTLGAIACIVATILGARLLLKALGVL